MIGVEEHNVHIVVCRKIKIDENVGRGGLYCTMLKMSVTCVKRVPREVRDTAAWLCGSS